MRKAKYDADGYRLRMVYNQWYIHLMKEGKPTGEQIGPLISDRIGMNDFQYANEIAKDLKLPDEDKKGAKSDS